jgi:hypothetical protein
MGEDNKKSFWTSIPGILTGIAAIIVAIGGIITALHIGSTQSPTPVISPTSTPVSIQSHVACGTQLPGISNLFGSWTWVGTNSGVTQSGLFTFKNDCTYKDIAKSGFTANDEGHFTISDSPTTIKLQNKLGKEHTYLITKINENSFHLSDLDNIINLDFIKTS